jgi:amidophosphoribosyltransferase
MESGPQDKCGVVGISFGDDRDVAPHLYNALRALQHRGQESAGIAVFDGAHLRSRRGMGMVHEVLGDLLERPLRGSSGIAHTRYSTTGGSHAVNAQPFVATCDLGDLGLGHNGDIVNATEIMQDRQARGWAFMTSSDSELILRMLANDLVDHPSVPAAMARVAKRIRGAYSLALQVGPVVYGVRDPLGIRPLFLGKVEGGHVIASESVAIDALGGERVRDVEPGEIVELTGGEVKSHRFAESPRRAHCMFEWVYFARPDSIIDGREVYKVRREIGAILADADGGSIKADVVFGVPDSGRAHALGYARASGIEYDEGLMKNRYIGRTFILPEKGQRESDVRAKLNPIRSVVSGKRIVMVDDSIVRGTTMRRIVGLLRSAGAKEVHVRLGVPPIIAPCPYGIDMKTREQFLARGRTNQEIAKVIGADSVRYLDLDGLERAIGKPLSDLCTGCLTEKYPVPLPGPPEPSCCG